MHLDFEGRLYRWQARQDELWTFVDLPLSESDLVRDATADRPRRGFGAVRVDVRIGTSRWRTSIFPAGADGRYVLPVKRTVRVAQDLQTGDRTRVRLEVLDA